MCIPAFFINLVQIKHYFREWIIARNSSQKTMESLWFLRLWEPLTISPTFHKAGNKVGPHWSCTIQIKADTTGVRRSKSDLSKVWDSLELHKYGRSSPQALWKQNAGSKRVHKPLARVKPHRVTTSVREHMLHLLKSACHIQIERLIIMN